MVTLTKTNLSKDIPVEHLLTEEETLVKAKNEVVVEVAQTQQPTVVQDNTSTELAEAKKEAEEAKEEAEFWERAFGWAITVLFALCTVFSLVLGKVTGNVPLFATLEVLFGSVTIGVLMTNMMRPFHINL